MCVWHEDNKMSISVSIPTEEPEHSQTTGTLVCSSLNIAPCPLPRVSLSEFCVFHSFVFFYHKKSGFAGRQKGIVFTQSYFLRFLQALWEASVSSFTVLCRIPQCDYNVPRLSSLGFMILWSRLLWTFLAMSPCAHGKCFSKVWLGRELLGPRIRWP